MHYCKFYHGSSDNVKIYKVKDPTAAKTVSTSTESAAVTAHAKKRKKVGNTSSTSAIPRKNRTVLSPAAEMYLATDTSAVAGTDVDTADCVDSPTSDSSSAVVLTAKTFYSKRSVHKPSRYTNFDLCLSHIGTCDSVTHFDNSRVDVFFTVSFD